jgi:alpha-D-ribose 1-methylphosphonate 5-triphosphate synthase subunit PhnL
MPTLVVDGLEKTFSIHAQGTTLCALRALSFAVEPASICALVGPSGAGKSSVLKCIHRSYLPSAGRILFDNGEERIDLGAADDHVVLEQRARHIGFVTQFLHCLPRKSALDVVAAPLVQQRVAIEAARERAATLLEQLAIPRRLWHLPPATFSGGEQQRINIARGFVRRNRLLLLDEPTASLDRASAERVLELIRDARAAGTAIVAIWHDPDIVERLADQQVVIAAPLASAA